MTSNSLLWVFHEWTSPFKSLFQNAFYLWLGAAITPLLGFAFWGIVSRAYESGDIGIAAAALSIADLLARVSLLGLGSALVRFMPETGKKALLLNTVLGSVFLLTLVSSLVFLGALPLWSPELLLLRDPPYSLAFTVFAISLGLKYMLTSAFVSLRSAHYAFIKDLVGHLARICLILILILAPGPIAIISAMGLGWMLAAIAGMVLLCYLVPAYRPSLRASKSLLFQLVPFSLGSHVVYLLLTAPVLILPIMVVNALGPEQGAYFYMAWLVGSLLSSASFYLSTSLLAEGSYAPENLFRLSRAGLFGALAVTGLGAGIVILAADKLLAVFGSQYAANGAEVLRLVALASVPAALVYIYVAAELVRKNFKTIIGIGVTVAAVTLAVSYWTLPLWGLRGVGLGILAGQGIGATVALISLLRITRLMTRLQGLLSRPRKPELISE